MNTSSGSTLTTAQLGYDAAGRISGVTNGNFSAGYTYLANSPLIQQVAFKDGTTTRMTTTKSYDDSDGNLPNDGRWVGCPDHGVRDRSRWWHEPIRGVAHLVRGRFGHPPAIAPCDWTRGIHRCRSLAPWSGQHTWDGENRLIQMESQTSAPAGCKRKVIYTYDHQSRLISRKAYKDVSGSYAIQSDTKWVYDGWRQLAELNATNNLLVRGFTWGMDLSGDPEGAGGIGGLLMFTDGGTSTTHFYAYDGNGNVMALVKATDGTKSADYEYGPFGEVIRSSGTVSKTNPFRFSTKCQDDETELVYYGYRFYNAAIGRWVNRDPIEEGGGLNLVAIVGNRPISDFDMLGLADCCTDHFDNLKEGGNRLPAAAVICCEGKPKMCVYDPSGGNPLSSTGAKIIVSICLVAHEQEHINSIECNHCSVHQFPPKPGEECTAYRNEVKCLQTHRNDCGFFDWACRSDIDKAIAKTTRDADEACRRGL